MKLFKKLAAVAVAAVLALSMVGCGASVSQVKQDILDVMTDMSAAYGGEFKNTAAMDNTAQKLLDAAAEAAKENKDAPVKNLLESKTVQKAAGILETDVYFGTVTEYHEFKSAIVPDYYRQMMLMQDLMNENNQFDIGSSTDADDDDTSEKIEVGIATKEIDGKLYVLALTKQVK